MKDRTTVVVAAPLRSLLGRRRQLLAMLLAEQHRLGDTVDVDTRRRVQVHVEWLEREMTLLRGELQAAVARDPELRRRVEVLRSVPGVGELTAQVLLADLPELGELNRKQIAAMVGLAPAEEDRRIRGGRARARSALYMGALVAARHNPAIRAFYERLLAADKPKKLALAACMRKLLVTLNRMLKEGAVWEAPSSQERPKGAAARTSTTSR